MGHMIVTGTADGLFEIDFEGAVQRKTLLGKEVSVVSGDWVIADDVVAALSEDRTVSLPDGLVPRSLLSQAGGACIVGTSEARLFSVGPDGAEPIDSFDRIPNRDTWSTPWGGPPDVRSMARSATALFVNVHVGGVWRADDADEDPWVEIVAPDADVHQVVALDTTLAVAAGAGVGQSTDGGTTWTWSHEGLISPYSRAVAISDGWLLASASTGPGARNGNLYRRPLDKPNQAFKTCGGKGELPKRFAFNVNTFELVAEGELVALGTPSGELYLSEDAGETWRLLADALPGVRCVAFAE
jgi:hypothetical protein